MGGSPRVASHRKLVWTATARVGVIDTEDTLDDAEFQEFRERSANVSRGMWLTLFAAAFLIGVALALITDTGVGAAATFVILLAGFWPVRAWQRARWLRRFPELRQADFQWRPDPQRATRAQ